MSLACGR